MVSCVYLTTYNGPHLPPFYIGSSTVCRINAGYRGSVSSKKYRKTWKSELKLHPERFNTRIIKVCESRKEATEIERRLQVALKVVRSPLYINQAVASPDGYCGADFRGQNSPRYGKKARQETKDLLSTQRRGIKLGPNPKKAQCGTQNGMFGKTRSDGEKQALRLSRAKRTSEQNLSSYSRKKTEDELAKLRAVAKARTPEQNPRAKDWLITSPDGVKISLRGNFKKWCSENGLPSGSPVLRVDGKTMTSGKWSGWSVLRA